MKSSMELRDRTLIPLYYSDLRYYTTPLSQNAIFVNIMLHRTGQGISKLAPTEIWRKGQGQSFKAEEQHSNYLLYWK